MIQCYKNKKVLITGNTGFKGTWLTLTLHKFGAKVIGYSDKAPKPKSILSSQWLLKNIKQYYKKIEDKYSIEKVIYKEKPDIIFHLAAQPLVIESYKNPKETFQVNIMGTVNLLDSVKDINQFIPTVIITTDKVYATKIKKKYKEIDNLEGLDPYSTSKVCVENISKCYAKMGLKLITARAGNIIGGGDWSENRIIPDIMRSFINKKPINIRNPSYTRPWLYILDVIEGYLLIGQKLFNIDKTNYFTSYNLSPNYKKNYSVYELTKEIQKYLYINKINFNTKSIHEENKFLQLNSSKIHQELDWKAKTSFRNAIKKTANWYKINNNKNKLIYTENEIINYFSKKIKGSFNNIFNEKKYA